MKKSIAKLYEEQKRRNNKMVKEIAKRINKRNGKLVIGSLADFKKQQNLH